jgi:aryl-alcohol dehydrogenase-like predicted oxidoreductase
MEYRKLGRTDIDVSVICLGTMTWGEQNTQDEAFEQMDYALEQDINFFDTAELYPVPPSEKTYGDTETIIGNWLSARKKRDKIVLATKVVGPMIKAPHIREGKTRLTREIMEEALNDSLRRLQTDYVDLYQLHWPDRNMNKFGQMNYEHDEAEQMTPIEETLEALAAIQKTGKARHFGLSNESAWGAMKFIHYAEARGLPRMVSIQNPYNLLNRTFEIGLGEVAHREDVGLLAYSPLAFGALSGKYLNNARPEKARLTLYKRFARYKTINAAKAIKAYVELAKKHELDPAQMALAYVNSRRFVTSNIIGATTMDQLRANIASAGLVLSQEVFDEIEKIHERYSNPCP